jgi:hypothetical protein
VLELARVDDRATRRLLAQAAFDNAWTGEALRGAVDATRSGRWIDVDPAPGLQPPPPEEPADAPKKVAVGWALKRAERTVNDFAAVAEEWDQVDVAALSEKQPRRGGARISRRAHASAHGGEFRRASGGQFSQALKPRVGLAARPRQRYP